MIFDIILRAIKLIILVLQWSKYFFGKQKLITSSKFYYGAEPAKFRSKGAGVGVIKGKWPAPDSKLRSFENLDPEQDPEPLKFSRLHHPWFWGIYRPLSTHTSFSSIGKPLKTMKIFFRPLLHFFFIRTILLEHEAHFLLKILEQLRTIPASAEEQSLKFW